MRGLEIADPLTRSPYGHRIFQDLRCCCWLASSIAKMWCLTSRESLEALAADKASDGWLWRFRNRHGI